MNVIMVYAWMLWPSDDVEHERYCGLCMDGMDADMRFWE